MVNGELPEVWECVRDITQPTRGNAKFSVRQFAHHVRVQPVTVYKWGESNGNSMPADMVAPLTNFYGDLLLLETIATDCGCSVVKHPDAPMSPLDVARFMRECSDMIVVLSEHGGDAEARALVVKEGHELIRATLSVMAQVSL